MTQRAPAPASFDGLRETLRRRFDELSPHLQRLARITLDDPNSIAFGTVASVAARAGVQPSSVLRFARALGFAGYPSLQNVCRERLIEGAPTTRQQIVRSSAAGLPASEARRLLREHIEANIAALQALEADITDAGFAAALELMRGARIIYTIGQRRTFAAAAYLFYALTRSERHCQLLNGVGGMIPQQVAGIGSEDLLVAISFPEYSPQVVEVVTDAHIRGVPVLAITDSEASPIARHARASLLLRDRMLRRFRPMAGLLCLIQALVEAAAEPTGGPTLPADPSLPDG